MKGNADYYNTLVIFCLMLIFDSSTLILLAKVELLDVYLGGMSLMAAVPPEVEKECRGYKKTLDSMVIQRAIDGSRIDVIAVKDRKLISKLELDSAWGPGNQRRSCWP